MNTNQPPDTQVHAGCAINTNSAPLLGSRTAFRFGDIDDQKVLFASLPIEIRIVLNVTCLKVARAILELQLGLVSANQVAEN